MLFANYLTDTNEALLFLSYAIINQPKLNLQERPARHEVSAAEQGAARGAKESVLIGQDRGASFMHARNGLANRDRRYLAWSDRLAC